MEPLYCFSNFLWIFLRPKFLKNSLPSTKDPRPFWCQCSQLSPYSALANAPCPLLTSPALFLLPGWLLPSYPTGTLCLSCHHTSHCFLVGIFFFFLPFCVLVVHSPTGAEATPAPVPRDHHTVFWEVPHICRLAETCQHPGLAILGGKALSAIRDGPF